MGTHKNRLNEAVLMSTNDLCLRAKVKKKMFSPVNPSFTIKRGVRGCKLHGRVSMMKCAPSEASEQPDIDMV